MMYRLANDVLIPAIGFGTWEATDPEICAASVKLALETGYGHIDTAKIYKNEEFVGKGIKAWLEASPENKREDVFVTTKLWNAGQGYDSALTEFETSLKKLGLDYVDLYLIHWPNTKRMQTTIDSWKAFEKLFTEKKIRAIGVCNFKPHHFEELLPHTTIQPMVNQIELHPELQQEETVAYCRSKGILIEAWSPLMRGNLTNPALKAVAKKHGKSVAQVILKWDVQNGILPLPKSVTPSRIKENFDLGGFTLDDGDLAAIKAVNIDKRNFGADPDTMNYGFDKIK